MNYIEKLLNDEVMKQYSKPIIRIFRCVDSQPIMSSKKAYTCNEYCKLWHICRDREKLKTCFDYKYF
jgi:hypothetical protein